MPAGRCVSKQFHAYARPKRFAVVFYGLNIFGRKAAQLGETPRGSTHSPLKKSAAQDRGKLRKPFSLN
jgi:hypothetical protein